MPNPSIMRIESFIAGAHRSVHLATRLAELLPDDGLQQDLFQIQVELERIQESLLRPGPYRPATPSDRT